MPPLLPILRSPRTWLPATATLTLLAAIYLALRLTLGPLTPSQTAGYLILSSILAALAAILSAAATPVGGPNDPLIPAPSPARLWLTWAILADSLGLLLLLLPLDTPLSLLSALKAYLLLAAFTALCTALAAALRRFSPSLAVVTTTLAALAFTFAPVLLFPTLRFLTESSRQTLLTLAAASPAHQLYKIALQTGGKLAESNWGDSGLLYNHLYTFGSHTPFTTPPWYLATLAFALLTLPLAYLATRKP